MKKKNCGIGELTEAMIIDQLEDIARQSRAGFGDGPEFPIFGSVDRLDNKEVK